MSEPDVITYNKRIIHHFIVAETEGRVEEQAMHAFVIQRMIDIGGEGGSGDGAISSNGGVSVELIWNEAPSMSVHPNCYFMVILKNAPHRMRINLAALYLVQDFQYDFPENLSFNPVEAEKQFAEHGLLVYI